MNISLSTSVPQLPSARQTLASQALEQRPTAQKVPDDDGRTETKGPIEHMHTAAGQAKRRIKGTIDTSSLSPRQAQALDKVQRQFDRMHDRLQQAVESGGADRGGMQDGLDIIYGKLRDSLSDILASSKGTTLTRPSTDVSGLTLNRLG